MSRVIGSVRVTNMKYQWIRIDRYGNVLEDDDNMFSNSARLSGVVYMYRLKLLKVNNKQMRTGLFSLVPVSLTEIDSYVWEDTNGDNVNEKRK